MISLIRIDNIGVIRTKVNHKDDNTESGSTISTDEAKFYLPVEGHEKLPVNH